MEGNRHVSPSLEGWEDNLWFIYTPVSSVSSFSWLGIVSRERESK